MCITIISNVSYKVPTKSNILSVFHIMKNFYIARSKVKKKKKNTRPVTGKFLTVRAVEIQKAWISIDL